MSVDVQSSEILDLLGGVRPEIDFSASADFIKDGLLDSFDLVMLVSAIEQRYGLAVEGKEIVPENFSSLASIAGMVARSRARKGL